MKTLLVLWLLTFTTLATPNRSPNVVFILLDNCGQEWLGCYSSEEGCTPEIDRLASEGVRFEHCYTPPVCGPSRIVLLTGRYLLRSGFTVHHDAALYGGGGLDPAREVVFARPFREAGYATGIVGKWQINNLYDEPDVLRRHGFDEQVVWPGSIDTDRLSRPHQEMFADMVRYADRLVGDFVRALDELNLRDNTLVFIATDNGTEKERTARRNGRVMHGGLYQLTEAGGDVAMFANSPKLIPGGRTIALADFSDVFPTLCDLAGVPRPKDVVLDGRSHAAALRGEPVDATMGFANVIWQGDANARAIQSLAHTASPPLALNVTGRERVSIRELAHRFGELLGRAPVIVGEEAPTAWLFDATRSFELFGPVSVSLDEMVEATARWVQQGGASLGKPTHFETRDGNF